VDLDGDDHVRFPQHDVSSLTADQARDALIESGLWTALRTRPYDKVPAADSRPRSIFVTAMDTNPLAADPELIIAERREDFVIGLHVLTRLIEGPVYLCCGEGSAISGTDVAGVSVETFAGPHPAGLVGTHIHFLDPVGLQKTVWHIGYQDVIAYGALFRTGRLPVERVISIAGPMVEDPRLVRTRIGARLNEILGQKTCEDTCRLITGSVLSGRAVYAPNNFLGRYHTQVSMIREGTERELLGWQAPGLNKFSVTRTFASFWLGGRRRRFDMTSSTGGSRRAMVPIGVYEKVMPLDMLPTQLLRALIVQDTEDAQALGCLELGEEDLALCTFVCPSKYDYGPILRGNLTKIEHEG
jgi:Na+-transporting NADH:ubiquinone oxidoreductase subunit A